MPKCDSECETNWIIVEDGSENGPEPGETVNLSFSIDVGVLTGEHFAKIHVDFEDHAKDRFRVNILPCSAVVAVTDPLNSMMPLLVDGHQLPNDKQQLSLSGNYRC